MTTIHTSRPGQYPGIQYVIECKLNNKTLSAKSCDKINLFLDQFYGILNRPVTRAPFNPRKPFERCPHFGLYTGQKDVERALSKVAEMPECHARAALTKILTDGRNVIDRHVEFFKNDLEMQRREQMAGFIRPEGFMPTSMAGRCLYD